MIRLCRVHGSVWITPGILYHPFNISSMILRSLFDHTSFMPRHKINKKNAQTPTLPYPAAFCPPALARVHEA